MKCTSTCQSNDSKLTTKNSISGCDYNIMINIGTPPCSILNDKCDGRVTNLRDKKIIEEDDQDPTSKEVVEDPTSKEVVEDPTSKEVVEDPTSKEVVEDPTSKEVVEDPTSKEVVEDPTSKEVVEDPTSKEVANENDNTKKIKISPEVRKILSQLELTIAGKTQDILDADTYDSTGQNFYDCVKILSNYSDTLKLAKGNHLFKADCGIDLSCKNCLEAINSSIIVANKDSKKHSEIKGEAINSSEEVVFVSIIDLLQGEPIKEFVEML
ncbi:hypothetical protein wVul_0641 [Wolbachia endosymbiont of Armadillidium vulgare str. wVulC]|uniref:hypothetical protein n=1 Tax=Wolbachia endosymbiont of Armadillidium vulgare TaxID=77039 RepID=UPI00064A98E9|nr:hypothetical protein [Wolbachia endosymbiont of Armadillidium vulgare]KLT23438.1 hypothetical protein wVul_0641 [Wolbachia endosymbiont of Armadillidium vulgare str. wVulC]OJH30481.1 hypothetical protein Wxf_02979 [Armadillidium vulgare] [Wolbachia endosymbiont of Armadillidium vulgare]OJH30709.1 hypothetical protein Wxf_00065 [Wolbachia endosymbiont of Armadillidium vulgare]OJH31956.1 hypothetical protein Wxf_01374 [Wolbachia endosymbiont of Armadillidium vulgare]OJH31963.1 hypothetical pr